MTWRREQEDQPFPGELQKLLTSYKEATPVGEISPNFMPELWARIESRRKVTLSFGRLARGFVTAAAALCLMISAGIATQSTSVLQVSYVDALDDADEAEAESERL